MGSLKSKLKRLRGAGPGGASASGVSAAAPRSVTENLPWGERLAVGSGEVRLIQTWLSADHTHGHVPTGRALEVDALTVARLAFDPAVESVDLSRALFLDTETTGLSGGAGTVPFLVGIGAFEDGCFRVEQLLLERAGEERPMLEYLRARVESASCIVTYNGKSFDWPLLRTRYVLNRVPMVKPAAHVDLLHAARRIYRRRLARTRLVDLEVEVLGFERVDDVGGAAIPEIYFQFLRDGVPGPLGGVLEHNVHDIVALAGILSCLTEGYESLRLHEDGRDRLGYAEVAERHRDHGKAARFAHAAADAETGDAECRVRALLLAARVHRREGDVPGEGDALREALKHAEAAWLAKVHLELAKHYEHRVHDTSLALEHATRTEEAEGESASQRRVARLERRRERQPPEMPTSAAGSGGVESSMSSR